MFIIVDIFTCLICGFVSSFVRFATKTWKIKLLLGHYFRISNVRNCPLSPVIYKTFFFQ